MKSNKIPKFFKHGYVAGGLTKLSSGISVSINTLAVALGATAFQIGIIRALGFLGKALSQFVGLYYLNLFSSRKKAQIVGMVIELLPGLFVALIALTATHNWFVLLSVLVFFGGLMGKASYLVYYSWMGEIIPRNMRNEFFGTRSLVGQATNIIGFLIAFFVLRLDVAILTLLGFLYLTAYVLGNVEAGVYALHPDSERAELKENFVLKRVLKSFKNSTFSRFMLWFNLLNVVLTINVLYLEFYMIEVLSLSFYWIPISFIIIATSSATAFFYLKKLFTKLSFLSQAFFISLLAFISSVSWLLMQDLAFLVLSLFLTGFAAGALSLVQKVELINISEYSDKEANYAGFHFMESIIITIFIFAINSIQINEFNYNFIYYVTISLSIISLLILRKKGSAITLDH